MAPIIVPMLPARPTPRTTPVDMMHENTYNGIE